MRTRKDVESQIVDYETTLQRLNANLVATQADQAAHQKEHDQALLAGKSADVSELGNLRIKAESLSRLIETKQDELRRAKDELLNVGYAEKSAAWKTYQAQLHADLITLQQKLGANGIKGDFDHLKQTIENGRALTADPDGSMFLNRLDNVWVSASRELHNVWAALEVVNQSNPGRLTHAPVKDGIPGFGKLP